MADKKNEKGIALLIVLTAVLSLMIVVVEFVHSTRIHYAMALNLRDRLQAEYLAKSGLQLSLLVLKFQKQLEKTQKRVGDEATLVGAGPIYKQIPIDSHLLRAMLAGGEVINELNVKMTDENRKDLELFLDFTGNFAATIEDEAGKIDLNMLAVTTDQGAQGSQSGQPAGVSRSINPFGAATPTPTPTPEAPRQGNEKPTTVGEVTIEQLFALIEPQEYDYLFEDKTPRRDVIYNLVDWIDEDTYRSGFSGGVEDGVYAGSDPAYDVKNQRFFTVDEVGLVAGVTRDFLLTFRPALTVYGKDNRININSADKMVLKGLISKLIKSKNEEEVDKIVEWIDEYRNFKDQAEFLDGLKTFFGYEQSELDRVFLGVLGFQSGIFSVVATGSVGEEFEDGEAPRTVNVSIHAIVSNTDGATFTPGQPQQPGQLKILYWRMD